ncbi:hypothetical protein KIN20_017906 [Parelaphostrongylus tenuis]|uniref:C2H2-type domain-containing protein n=1 Tax=Parelaphostrongylus tenuis TaxID=148309 RepID=A0AAD5N6U8_PARTN|nr:hypothetical protein KIN20_017906 [Parelaphostrongylus tenuis]
MEDETKSGAYDTDAVVDESNLIEPLFELGQTVKEETIEDSLTVREETGENWVCYATDLLKASSSAHPSGNGARSRRKKASGKQKEPKQCLMCGEQFAFRSQLRRHFYEQHIDERLTCEECGRKFGSVGGLDRHNQVKHGKRPHKCLFFGCDHPDYSSIQGDTHHEGNLTEPHSEPGQTLIVEEEVGEDLFTVKEETEENRVCFATDLLEASSSVDVSGHYVPPDNLLSDEEKVPKILHAADVNLKEEHEESFVEVPNQCMKCGEHFAFKFQLQRHFYNQHLDDRLTCEECGRKFGSVGGLNTHKQVVHRNRVFMCSYEGCDRPGYKSRKSLIAHIRSVHTHVRPFVCKICEKGFATNDRLRVHSFTHSRNVCICGVKFLHKASLDKHQRVCLLYKSESVVDDDVNS